jgi:thiol-disulfide isomerase/thioredoxin
MTNKQIFKDKQKRSKKSRFLGYGFQFLLVVAIVIGVNAWRTRDAVGGIAPQLNDTTLTGETFQLSPTAGEPVYVHFWATWCPVCDAQDGNIQSLSEDYPVITVAMASGSDDEVRQHLIDNELDFRVINDESGAISNRWGVSGVPTTFIIDGQGEIRFVEMGYTTTLGLKLRRWLTKVTNIKL